MDIAHGYCYKSPYRLPHGWINCLHARYIDVCMAPRPYQIHLLLLLLSAAVAASSSSKYGFPVFDGKSTADGVVVATNSSMLSPATFLFDAQLFPVFNQSEGFVLLSRAVALRGAAGDDASFNTTFTLDVVGDSSGAVAFVVLLDSFPPFNLKNRKHGATNGSVMSSTGAHVPSAGNSLAAVEVGTVNSYGPRPSPGVGLNVTITPNRSSAGAGVSQLAVRIEYDAAAHRLLVFVDHADAGDTWLSGAPALLNAPLDLAGRLPTQSALVGFFAATVRDVVVGISGWELTVDALPDDDGDGPPRPQDDEQSTTSTSWVVVLFAVLGSVAAVGVAVVSVMLYRAASRRRLADMEVQKCYREYLARMPR
ncbi:unnamed protein product [Alopecurus aequalis]